MTDLLVRSLGLTTRPGPTETPAMHGIDSLGFVELILDLEELSGRDFPADPGVTEHSTLAEIADMAAKELMQ